MEFDLLDRLIQPVYTKEEFKIWKLLGGSETWSQNWMLVGKRGDNGSIKVKQWHKHIYESNVLANV